MGAAKICECGHQKSDHKEYHRKRIYFRGECDWDICDCKKFVFAYSRAANHNNPNGNLNDIEQKIIFDISKPLPPLPKPKKREVYLSDVNSKGVLVTRETIKKPRFNNGEYP